jgi:selenocysteine lyase/cysteine desulfurase
VQFYVFNRFQVDYFVMSTHKWLCNVKTCGIIRFGEKSRPPNPPAISFGWDLPAKNRKEPTLEETLSRFLWIGMLDSYISYITLGKAIQVFAGQKRFQIFRD